MGLRYQRKLSTAFTPKEGTSMIVNLNIPSFGELVRKYVYNFRNRLETSDNVIIRGIYLSHITFQSGILGYEPADLTVHPPPKTIEGGLIFFA